MDHERKQQLQRVRAMEELVREAVNGTDPLGLLRGGAPQNEYDQEIGLILGGFVRLGPDQAELAALITNVFEKKFWVGAVSESQANRIAEQICRGWAKVVPLE